MSQEEAHLVTNTTLENLPWVITHGDDNTYIVEYVPRSALFSPTVDTNDAYPDVRYGLMTKLCCIAENIYPGSLGGATNYRTNTLTFVQKHSHLKPIYDSDGAKKISPVYIPLSSMADYLSSRIDNIIHKKARVGDENNSNNSVCKV